MSKGPSWLGDLSACSAKNSYQVEEVEERPAKLAGRAQVGAGAGGLCKEMHGQEGYRQKKIFDNARNSTKKTAFKTCI